MLIGDRYVNSPDVSSAWLDSIRCLQSYPSRKAVHLAVRVAHPTLEQEKIRIAAQTLIDGLNARLPLQRHYNHIDTTRNTIFPATWARRYPDPLDLADYYRARYTKDGLLGFKGNERGTYFGRLVAYPRGDHQKPGDQLTLAVAKLKAELAGGRPKSSRYEINVYCERVDTNPMSFPCLAHLSVHLHDGLLHMQAIYRNELLVARGYGNYLGLGQLQQYIATAAGIEAGELFLTFGHVELDAPRQDILQLFSALEAQVLDPADHNE